MYVKWIVAQDETKMKNNYIKTRKDSKFFGWFFASEVNVNILLQKKLSSIKRDPRNYGAYYT
jgi:hypothetical protein